MAARPPEYSAPSIAQGERHAICGSVAWMGRYNQPDLAAELIEQNRYVFTDRDSSLHRLQWTRSLHSQAQWVEGPAATNKPSQNTLTTALMIAGFQRTPIPVISYFCCYGQRNNGSVSYGRELLKMVFALIYQVAKILPPDPSSYLGSHDIPDLSASRVISLQPDLESLPGAIKLFKDMLDIAPSTFGFCIDGLQFLDKDGEGEWYQSCFKQFVEVLGTAKTSIPRVLKMWLSTDGHSASLQNAVNNGWMETHKTNLENQDESVKIDMIEAIGDVDAML